MSTYNLGRVGLKPKGTYSESENYSRLDVVFYNGSSYVALDDSMGIEPTNTAYWQMLANGFEDSPPITIPTLRYGTLPDSNIGNGQLRWRRQGNHIFISGGVTARYTGTGSVLISLGVNAAPQYGNACALRPCSGGRIARIYVNTIGDLYLDWIKNMSDGSNYTSAAAWIDCNFDYWIN